MDDSTAAFLIFFAFCVPRARTLPATLHHSRQQDLTVPLRRPRPSKRNVYVVLSRLSYYNDYYSYSYQSTTFPFSFLFLFGEYTAWWRGADVLRALIVFTSWLLKKRNIKERPTFSMCKSIAELLEWLNACWWKKEKKRLKTSRRRRRRRFFEFVDWRRD